jgi:hypothetical protein
MGLPLPGGTAHDHPDRHRARPQRQPCRQACRTRYRIPAGERVLHGQRINGVVRVTDNPAGGRGRAYLVERELEQDGNSALQALVADYVEQAERHGAIPMDVPLGRYLAHIDD